MVGLVALALLPVALLIALGHALKRSGFLGESFWPQAERLTYYVLLPALFLHSMATAEISTLPVWELAVVLIGSTLLVAAGLVLTRPAMQIQGDAFTSVFQGAIRFNSYIGVTMAAWLFGGRGIALAALCSAVLVPLVNVLAILVFARFGTARLNVRGVVMQVVTNPLVLSCLGGLALQALHTKLPAGLEPALKSLGAASMPMGLLCVGAALHFGAARRWVKPLVISSSVKFMVLPAATFVIAKAVGASETTLLIAMLFQTLPTASSSYILARQLGGDAPLMAGITATQTVLAALAMPLILGLIAG